MCSHSLPKDAPDGEQLPCRPHVPGMGREQALVGGLSRSGGTWSFAFGGIQMRRVAMLAFCIGLTLTGIAGSAAAWPAAAVSTRSGLAGAGVTRWLGPVPAKAVSYAGYVLTVPASWPVYRLSRGSSQFVRYDRHAVYLGQPAAGQAPAAPAPAWAAGQLGRSQHGWLHVRWGFDTCSAPSLRTGPIAAGPGRSSPGWWRCGAC